MSPTCATRVVFRMRRSLSVTCKHGARFGPMTPSVYRKHVSEQSSSEGARRLCGI
jgi:hypothetical protein